jgi:outer membrane protein assembly factor BamB
VLSKVTAQDVAPASLQGTPAVRNGNIYFGDTLGNVHLVDPIGHDVYNVDGSAITCSPAIGANGNVYVTTANQTLQALDEDLNPTWTVTNVRCQNGMVVSADGILYIPMPSGKMIGIQDVGSPLQVMFVDTYDFSGRSAPLLDIYNGKPRLIHVAGDIVYSWVKK